MTQRIKSEQGFGVAAIIALVAVVAVIGVGGWYVWSKQQVAKNPTNTQETPSTKAQQSKLTLAEGKVTLLIPNGWSASTNHLNGDKCMHTLASTVTCLDQTSINPNTTPDFSTTIAVYSQGNAISAKDWWQNSYDGSSDSGTVDGGTLTNPSTTKIAGFDAYHFTSQSATSTTVWYVVASQNHVALLTAVVKQPGNTADAQARDYTAYLPSLDTLVSSIHFQ